VIGGNASAGDEIPDLSRATAPMKFKK